jgi:hypothetical protein
VEIREATTVPAPVDELWELLISARGAARWLGTDSREPPTVGTLVRLRGRPGRGAIKGVDGIARTVEVSFGDRCASVRFAAKGGTTGVEVVEEVEESQAAMVKAAWHVALSAAWLAWSEAAEAREPRQALVLIHGIGEQRPGATAQSITDALIGPGRYLSKPDRVSGSYELRRLQVLRDKQADLPRTDIFELYWGHRVRDTQLRQVTRWLVDILRRRRRDVSSGLRGLWWLSRILVVLALVTAGLLVVTIGFDGVSRLWSDLTALTRVWWVSVVLTGVVGVVTGWMVSSLGDAARYLSSHPDNVTVRTDIRAAGIDLLRRLHDDGRYHRIVVAGHSLGSVVGYDVLYHYWAEASVLHDHPNTPDPKPIADYEAVAPTTAGVAHQAVQQQLWAGLRRNGVPWLVTDFVTFGSPLAHAGTLLAASPAQLEELKAARVLACSPPQPDPRSPKAPYSYRRPYLSAEGLPSMPVLHHAALFGPTRWTNLYSRAAGGIMGDFVGGEIAPAFGAGVVDREVRYSRWRVRNSIAAHTSYWRDDPAAGEDGGLVLLRAALDLNCHEQLSELAATRPLASFLPPTTE